MPERVGQLLMVGADSGSLDSRAVSAITAQHVGSVILMGNSDLSPAATAAVTGGLQQAAAGTKLFIATDQEGGEVRRMRGPGFDQMPSALAQGTLAPATLRAQSQAWGAQLRAAGINVDLAPVADTVPGPAAAQTNPPIGQLDREYGYDPGTVAAHAVAFAQGMAAAGVSATAKHFPGLGRVTGNTDTTAGVTDDVTTADDPDLAPFTATIVAGVPFVMMSTAVYSKIDPDRPAAFSSTVVTGLLRRQLGFHGVVISDDLGAAVQVAGYPVGARAVDFIAAGGDLVLTVVPDQAAAMSSALLARAASDPAFAAQVDAAALTVLIAKDQRGLLPS